MIEGYVRSKGDDHHLPLDTKTGGHMQQWSESEHMGCYSVRSKRRKDPKENKWELALTAMGCMSEY